MILTGPQREAARHDGHTLVVACPGSGKTRALTAKLLRCVEEVRNSARKVACITYTNAAVYEIESRLRAYGTTGDDDYCDISTIHAFCLNNVLRYFDWKLLGYPDGLTVLPPDSEQYRQIVVSICDDHGFGTRARENFELLNREPDGTPITEPPLTPEVALDFWGRLQGQGCIDFANIIYLSYRLMSDWPTIAHALACRFAWVLVDEFQDTSALQVEIFRLIGRAGRTKFFLVGDPYQSIFGFAGARPDLMREFAKEIKAWRSPELLINFRSGNPVIQHAERLCPRRPPMRPGGDAAAYSDQPIYVHTDTAFRGVIDYFVPALEELGIEYGNAAILAPWWVKLLQLGRQLRDYGIPIVGPGARPYRRSHLFASLAEEMCAYIEQPDPELIPCIEKELFLLLNQVTESINYRVYTYGGRTAVFRLIRVAQRLREIHEGGVLWLRAAAEEFAAILCAAEFLPASCGHLLNDSVTGMEADMRRQGVDVENLSVADLGIFASNEKNIKLLTMHRAKGREFEAVALVDLHDGRIPHFSARTEDEIDEARRLIYVSITRARRILMYITDEEDWRNRPSRFLLRGELGLIS